MTSTDRKISIREIADHAGVSLATVSRAVHQKRGVSEAARGKITEAMTYFGVYEPVIRKSDMLLTLLPDIESAFYAEIARGISAAAQSHGYLVAMICAGGTELNADTLERLLARTGACAAILLSPLDPEDAACRIAERIPLIQCGAGDEHTGISSVTIDEEEVCRAVSAYMLTRGKRNIAIFSDPASNARIEQRIRGYHAACAESEMESPLKPNVQLLPVEEGKYLSFLTHFLRADSRPDAIFAASDRIAVAVAKVAKQLGLEIPADLGIVGLNNTGWQEYTDPVLTTVHLPLYRMGFLACEIAAGQLRNNDFTPYNLVVDTEILVRDSL